MSLLLMSGPMTFWLSLIFLLVSNAAENGVDVNILALVRARGVGTRILEYTFFL